MSHVLLGATEVVVIERFLRELDGKTSVKALMQFWHPEMLDAVWRQLGQGFGTSRLSDQLRADIRAVVISRMSACLRTESATNLAILRHAWCRMNAGSSGIDDAIDQLLDRHREHLASTLEKRQRSPKDGDYSVSAIIRALSAQE